MSIEHYVDRKRATVPSEIHTYPAMNERIKEILALSPHDNPMNLYILARIKELEAENEALKRKLPILSSPKSKKYWAFLQFVPR